MSGELTAADVYQAMKMQAGTILAREVDRLRQQRAAALALHVRDVAGEIGPANPGVCEVCMHEWPCPTVRALGAADEPTQAEIPAEDLQVDRYFAADQPVNQNARGVSLTHLPTRLTVSVHSERTALQNQVLALAELRRLIAERTADEPTTGGGSDA